MCPVIHGEASGKPLSMLKATCFAPLPRGFAGDEEWFGDAVIESHIATDDGEPPFTKLRTTFPYLHVWLGLQPIVADSLPEENGLRVVAKPALVCDTEIVDGGSIQLYHSLACRTSGYVMTIEQPVNVVVAPLSPTPWRRIMDRFISPFEALLWLATVRHVGAGDVWVWHQGKPDWRPDWVRLHAPFIHPSQRGPHHHELHRHELLFLADELPGGFDAALRRWYGLWQTYSGIINPLMALDRAPFSYTDDRFATAVAAAEGYHSLRFGDRDLSRTEHRARVEALRLVLGRHAPELAEWVVPIAEGANRVPLKRRLRYLMGLASETGHGLVGEDCDLLIEQIEEVRNGYAHGRHSENRLSFDSGARHWAAEAMKWLVRTALLLELGFSEAEVARRVAGHPEFVFVGDQLQGFLAKE